MRVSKVRWGFLPQFKMGAYTKANEITKYPAFNPKNAAGESQVLFYKDYRPDLLHYPLPDYFGAKQYIEIDTEISISTTIISKVTFRLEPLLLSLTVSLRKKNRPLLKGT